MNPLGTRARAEELARLLDGARTGASTGGGAAALSSYGDLASRLRAVGAGLTPVSAPRDEFRATLRTRLMAVAAVQSYNAAAAPAATAKSSKGAKISAVESAVSWSQSRRVQRGMGVAAGAMASVVAVAGIAVAGNQSLPGDPFYGVKKGGEALELRTSDGAVAKGSKHLDFAAERLSEIKGLTLGRDAALGAMAGTGPQAASAFGSTVSERIRRTLADMDTETRRGSELLTASYRETQAEAPLQILAAFAGTQTSELRALLPDLPTAARERGEVSLALVTEVAAQTSAMLAIGVCTGACSPAATAPSLPGPEGLPAPQPAPSATSNAPCGCSPTAPQPSSPAGQPEPTPMPTPSESADPAPTTPPSSPTPTSSPSPSQSPNPLPVPLPVPLPTLTPLPPLPVPVPVPSAPALVPGIPVPGAPLPTTTGLAAPLS